MRSAEEIERIVKEMSFRAGPQTDAHLWADVSRAQPWQENAPPVLDRKNLRRWSMRHPISKLAIAALIGVGGITAVVVGVNVGQYYFEGRQPDGTYRFRSDQTFDGGTYRDANGVEQPLITRKTTVVTVGPDSPDGTLDVERTKRDLAEIDRLCQQDIRDLKAVSEIEVNGTRERPVLYYSYTLADGRSILRNERDPDDRDYKEVLTADQWQEFHQLRRAGPGADLGTQEKEVKGRMFTFQRQRFVLRDGTQIIWSEGVPKSSQ
jgi:hypothetical protein